MSNEEETLPPRSKTLLLRAIAWAKAHPDYAWPMAAFAVGFVLGAVLL